MEVEPVHCDVSEAVHAEIIGRDRAGDGDGLRRAHTHGVCEEDRSARHSEEDKTLRPSAVHRAGIQ